MDVVALSEQDEAAIKAVKRQGRLNGIESLLRWRIYMMRIWTFSDNEWESKKRNLKLFLPLYSFVGMGNNISN